MKAQDLPKRKRVRILNYDYSQSGAYFVTICTHDRRRLLSRIVGDDAHIVPLPCGTIVEKYIKNAPEITKYVIMPDHVHIIIELHNGSMCETTYVSRKDNRLASIVRSIKSLTTKEVGMSIFQRGYYDHVIRNQQDYDEIWEYIDNNPRKWIMQNRGYE